MKIKYAEDFASNAMHTKRSELPVLAYEYMSHLASRYAACSEIFIAAFIQYALIVEGLPSNEKQNKDPEAVEWFRQKGVNV